MAEGSTPTIAVGGKIEVPFISNADMKKLLAAQKSRELNPSPSGEKKKKVAPPGFGGHYAPKEKPFFRIANAKGQEKKLISSQYSELTKCLGQERHPISVMGRKFLVDSLTGAPIPWCFVVIPLPSFYKFLSDRPLAPKDRTQQYAPASHSIGAFASMENALAYLIHYMKFNRQDAIVSDLITYYYGTKKSPDDSTILRAFKSASNSRVFGGTGNLLVPGQLGRSKNVARNEAYHYYATQEERNNYHNLVNMLALCPSPYQDGPSFPSFAEYQEADEKYRTLRKQKASNLEIWKEHLSRVGADKGEEFYNEALPILKQQKKKAERKIAKYARKLAGQAVADDSSSSEESSSDEGSENEEEEEVLLDVKKQFAASKPTIKPSKKTSPPPSKKRKLEEAAPPPSAAEEEMEEEGEEEEEVDE